HFYFSSSCAVQLGSLFDLINYQLFSLKSLTLVCDKLLDRYELDLPVIARLEVFQLTSERDSKARIIEMLANYAQPHLHTIRLGDPVRLWFGWRTDDSF